jgi:hypothetical protein
MIRNRLTLLAAVTILLAVVALAVSVAAQERVRLEHGEFEYLATSNGILITAPHGTFDINTDALAIAVARKLGSGYLIFRGTTPAGQRINVNRPTEGAGRTCPNEERSDRAQIVYETYLRLTRAASGAAPPALYVEIHGNANPRSAQNIEVASKGVSAAEASGLKEHYLAALPAVQRDWPRFPTLELLVEPADRVFFTASCLKTIGILSIDLFARALHFEFPRFVREADLLEASATLTAALLQDLPSRR